MFWTYEQTKGIKMERSRIEGARPNFIILSKEDNGEYTIYGASDRLFDIEEHLVESLNKERIKQGGHPKYVPNK